jgi:hypothetical protein
MNLLSWNCWGLGNLRTVRELRRMVKDKKPKIVFLMETKARAKRMERVRSQLGFEHMLVVDYVGKSGGLALLWTTEVDVEIQNYSYRHINAKVCSTQSNFVWKLTGFYGHPEASKRIEAWQLLRFIARMDPSPWICLGDFNEILSLDEKFGGSGRQRGLMENFQMALEESRLSELGYVGPKFTWNNGQEGADFIKERLDRVVANKEWCEAHSDVEVVVGPAICYDHSPL